MREKQIIIGIVLVFCTMFCAAQYTQVGSGLGQNTNNTYGPMRTINSSPEFNRHAYIYPSASISSIQHGDTIRSIEFMRSNADTIAGTTQLKIYLKNAYKSHFGTGSINWASEARDSGMTLVYDANPRNSIGTRAGFVRFDFTEVNYFVFDTSGGAVNLEILVEYTQTTNQVNPSLWFIESGTSVPGFVDGNESKYISGGSSNWLDSITTGSSILKPTLRLNHPIYNHQLEVLNIYALGTVPILMDRPDTIKAIIRNSGKLTVYNHKVYVEMGGVNSYIDSVQIDSIRPFEELLVYFGNYEPVNQGTESIRVYVAPDDYAADNENTKSRIVNYNEYSHFDPFGGTAGGIGFNGSTGDFVGKFYVEGNGWINQIKVDFSSSNRPFKLAVWKDDGPGGGPGTVLYESDTLVSTPGTFILPVSPRIQVSGGYYVGIRQTSTTNVAFSFQYERPVRPHVFYFAAPMGDTNWVPFAPGFDFNFNIRPRLQVANDLAIEEFINPLEGDSMLYSTTDSLYPSARVVNYGFVAQNNFEVKLEIRDQNNFLIHSDSKIISLGIAKDSVVEFEPMGLYAIGKFKAKASVDLNIDSVKDNNFKEVNFSIIKRHDVAADLIFEPKSGDSFEIKNEGFWPQVRIINYGTVAQTNFPVTIRLLQDGQVLQSQTKMESLQGNGDSRILVFDSVFLTKSGWQDFEAYTGLYRDSFPINDTSRSRIYGKVSNDVGVLSIINPKEVQKISTKINIQPFINIRNHGFKAQDSIYVTAVIYNSSGLQVYSDTIIRALNFFSTAQVIFKNFYTGNQPGKYRLFVAVRIDKDQIRENDTLSRWFETADGRDLALIDFTVPDTDPVILGSDGILPSLRIRNNGLLSASNVPVVLNLYRESGGLIYTDTILVESIGIDDTLTLVAVNSLNYNERGFFDLYAVNIWSSEDKRTSNDSLHLRFEVNTNLDLAIIDHLNPYDLDTVPVNTGFLPRLRLENKGFDTLFNIMIAIEVEASTGGVVMMDTISYDFLESGGIADVSAGEMKVSLPGSYHFRSSFIGTDDWATDNQFSTVFVAIVDNDIAIDSAVFPKAGNILKTNTDHKPLVWVSNRGLFDSEIFSVYCLVKVDGSEIYYKSSDISLDSGEFMMVEFDSSLNYDKNANAELLFFVNYFNDRVRENDSLQVLFEFNDKLSVSYNDIPGLQVYPNPFELYFRVNASVPVTEIVLFDELGREVYKRDVNSLNILIQADDLTPGIYYLKVGTASGFTYVKMLMGRG